MTVLELITEIRKDRIFYDDSGGGVTFSGGEPLMQFEFLRAVLTACRGEGIHTALDTCGHAPREQLLAAASLADLVLYDLKMMDTGRHRHYTGVDNGRILENLVALGREHSRIWLRVPVIPGINDVADEWEQIARFAAGIPGIQRLCLLPYHALGLHKNQRLGRTYRLAETAAPGPERLEEIARLFRQAGFEVITGG